MKESAVKSILKKIPSLIGIALCIVLVPIMIMNLTIVIKSYIEPDQVPDFLGIKPFVVITGSMEPEINGGDLVITKTIDPADLRENDIISYKEGNAVITHRILKLTEKDGSDAFITKGDANNTEDGEAVTWSQVEGIYLFKIARLGQLVMFMQTPIGMLLFIGLPLCGFIIYDFIRRRILEKEEEKHADKIRAEIAVLKAQLAEKEGRI